MTYSQRGEDDVIAPYLPSTGRYLEIGSYDGKTFSNTRQLAENGWEGVCVEPAAHAFAAMVEDPAPGATLVNALIGPRPGLTLFHYSKDAVSTTERSHARKWSSMVTFTPTFSAAVTIDDLLRAFPGPFHVISIDTEGTSLEILDDLRPHLEALDTRLLIVETDGHDVSVDGFKLVHHTVENAILVR